MLRNCIFELPYRFGRRAMNDRVRNCLAWIWLDDCSPGLRAGNAARDLNERGTMPGGETVTLFVMLGIKKWGTTSCCLAWSGKEENNSRFLKSEFRIQRCRVSALAEH